MVKFILRNLKVYFASNINKTIAFKQLKKN